MHSVVQRVEVANQLAVEDACDVVDVELNQHLGRPMRKRQVKVAGI